ncbi:MAG: hypothetical protein ABIH83_02965 [Candidatus Micrarchaeota archaeon]
MFASSKDAALRLPFFTPDPVNNAFFYYFKNETAKGAGLGGVLSKTTSDWLGSWAACIGPKNSKGARMLVQELSHELRKFLKEDEGQATFSVSGINTGLAKMDLSFVLNPTIRTDVGLLVKTKGLMKFCANLGYSSHNALFIDFLYNDEKEDPFNQNLSTPFAYNLNIDLTGAALIPYSDIASYAFLFNSRGGYSYEKDIKGINPVFIPMLFIDANFEYNFPPGITKSARAIQFIRKGKPPITRSDAYAPSPCRLQLGFTTTGLSPQLLADAALKDSDTFYTHAPHWKTGYFPNLNPYIAFLCNFSENLFTKLAIKGGGLPDGIGHKETSLSVKWSSLGYPENQNVIYLNQIKPANLSFSGRVAYRSPLGISGPQGFKAGVVSFNTIASYEFTRHISNTPLTFNLDVGLFGGFSAKDSRVNAFNGTVGLKLSVDPYTIFNDSKQENEKTFLPLMTPSRR